MKKAKEYIGVFDPVTNGFDFYSVHNTIEEALAAQSFRAVAPSKSVKKWLMRHNSEPFRGALKSTRKRG